MRIGHQVRWFLVGWLSVNFTFIIMCFKYIVESESVSHSVMSDSLRLHGL